MNSILAATPPMGWNSWKMIFSKTKPFFWLFLLFCIQAATNPAVAQTSPAKPFLHPLFSDGMVLQREIAAPVWGWTTPNARVTVAINGQITRATAGADGKWMTRVGPFAAGGPYTLNISGPQSVALRNVMLGDVWLCTGQSNMQFGVGVANDATKEIAAANYPNIRLFSVPQKLATTPQSTVDASWQVCTPQTISSGGWGGFSAVGYFFGRELHQKLGVPIGLIHSSWGGTVAEAWTSASALATLPDFAPAVSRFGNSVREQNQPGYSYATAMTNWWSVDDAGSRIGAEWFRTGADDTNWKTLDLPAMTETVAPNFNGVTWFRREFELPAGWMGKDLVLQLGTIDERDTTWVNGVQVGENNDNWTSRNYKIPANLLKTGRNVVAVRVYDIGGPGGFSGPVEAMKIQIEGDTQAPPIALAGAWKYQISTPLAQMTTEPQRLTDPNNVSVLYNGLIAPLAPFGIKGAIWYQGESNSGRGRQYRTLLPTLIRDWRSRFGQGDFPFYIVQLANWGKVNAQPGESGWAELQEAQALTAQTVANTGLATAIDVGDADDIHPKNKQEVGHRLALQALARTYGQQIEASGPVFQNLQVEGSKARLNFTHATKLGFAGDKLQGFAIAGADRKFVWADAKIEGESVIVSSPQVERPVAVRYAWADNPVANLKNGAGLPSFPFRTDRP